MYRSPHMPASEKSKAMPVLQTVMKILRILGCSRRDDIIERAYNMPDMPSSRPSIARTSMSRPSATGPSTTLFPRQDSSLLRRTQSRARSQRQGSQDNDAI